MKAWRRFYKAGTIALISIYLVILAGAVVRTTGSGMGCPDWPKCFGNWVPPTDISQLPADYKVRYNTHGHELEDFNAAKTWTEYINRLVGALAGFFVFIMAVQAFRLRKESWRPFYMSALALVLMGFQAWLGKKVVDTNLKENMITIHMVVAVLIMFLMLYTLRSKFTSGITKPMPKRLANLQLVLVVLSLVQLALGSQVREQVDAIAIANAYQDRAGWIGQLDVQFYIHRSFSLILVVLMVYLYIQIRRAKVQRVIRLYRLSLVLLGIMIGSGVILAYLGLPAAVQPVHLLFSTLLLSCIFVGYLQLDTKSA